VGRLSELGTSVAVLAAPMAGGPTTPELVVAAAEAGSLGFLGAGYQTPEAFGEQIDQVRERTSVFGVNLFAPNPVPAHPAEYARYRQLLLRDAERFGVALPETPTEDDDHWRDKIDVLLAKPVPLVSFTFGIPDPAVLAALRAVGTLLAQTVTSPAEARLAADAGVDVLIVQAAAAGGHSATLTPAQLPPTVPLPELLARVRSVVDLPMVGAGGLGDAVAVASAMGAGAEAVLVGTALLLAPESGTSDPYRAALVGPRRGNPVLTRAFTGRPARGLRNAFLDAYDAVAPAGYPAVHYLTRPLRRASAAAGDPEFLNLWAGTAYRTATARPAGETLQALAAEL
jgi:nitronate monooxygenase